MSVEDQTASTSDARKRKAEEVEHHCRPECVEPDAHVAADLPPILPNPREEGWVLRAAGDVIEAGTPYVAKWPDDESYSEAFPHGTAKPLRVPEDCCTYWTPPPVPRAPWEDISTDREKPTLARVTSNRNTFVGEFWVDGDRVRRVEHVGTGWLCLDEEVESVELLHTFTPVTQVPVDRALIDEAAAWNKGGAVRQSHQIVADLAAFADGAEKGAES